MYLEYILVIYFRNFFIKNEKIIYYFDIFFLIFHNLKKKMIVKDNINWIFLFLKLSVFLIKNKK